MLDFSDSSFAAFFAKELNVDLDNPAYAEKGGSKGKRLRCFLQKVDNTSAVRTLRARWEHRTSGQLTLGDSPRCRTPRDAPIAPNNGGEGKMPSPFGRMPLPSPPLHSRLAPRTLQQSQHTSLTQLDPNCEGSGWRVSLRCVVKLRTPISFFIFAGSYLPLSMILLAQNYDYATNAWPGCWEWIILEATCKAPFKNPGFAFPFFLGCLACLIISMSVLSAVKPKGHIIIKSVKHTPADLMNYVLPYVVSFMSIDYQETGKFIGFSIFMIWMFWITHASGQVILNPLLTVFKWQLYEVIYRYPADSVEYTSRALSRVHLAAGKTYKRAMVQAIIIIKQPSLEETNDDS